VRRAIALIVLAGAAREAAAQSCFNYLNRQTYQGGFAQANFSSTTATQVSGGNLQLNQALMPLDANHIILPFDQDVKVTSVYFNAGATHTLGWFYLDQLSPTYYNMGNGTLVDANGNGVPDFYEALFQQQGNFPKLLSGNTGYSDGGNYPHIPNLLEPSPVGVGHIIFQIMNDNGATGWTFNYNGVNLPPIQDGSGVVDNIYDYDVNGDGLIANEPDRTVDLGVIQGNREIVFFLNVYWWQTGENLAFGMTGVGQQNTGITPLFSKAILNPDQGGVGANATIRYTDLGAVSLKGNGGFCESATPANSPGGVPTPIVGQFVPCPWNPYPGATTNADATQQNTVRGFLNQSTINLLNTPTYGNLVMPHEVHRVVAGSNGAAPHTFVGAPSTDPNRWILGFEDLLGYTPNSCVNCTNSDFSLDDVVVMINRVNGGAATSTVVSTEIPANDLANTTISKVHVNYAASFPPPCSAPPNSRVDIYFSVDGGATWHLVDFPPNSTDTTIDVLGMGLVGNQLEWKANFVTDTAGCQPYISSLNIGYEALDGGIYQYGESIPVANAVFRGQFETASANWVTTGNDRSPRGHLKMTQLYNPDTGANAQQLIWDAGPQLAAMSPNNRSVWFNSAGVTSQFVATNAATWQQVLPNAIRGNTNNGSLVYDLNGDGVVNDLDAQVIVQWTRGWETANVKRAWPLGAIFHSTPAIVGPVGHPWWVDGSGTPAGEKSTFLTFAGANASRRAVAIAGAADGLIHAFDAGAFFYGDDPSTGVIETRGYFLKLNGNQGRDYGNGSEVWAFVPPTQMGNLKNNLPALAAYQPDLNPRASVDGAVTAVDVYNGNNAFKSVVYAGEGTTWPYLTAVDVTSATAPAVFWPNGDWTDVNFNGTIWGPSAGPTLTAGGRRWLLTVSSGLATLAEDLYLYFIDAVQGTTVSKVKLNVGNGGQAAQTLGSVGPPVMVDSDGDGMIDRVYLADANGRIFKVNTASNQACLIASLGESVYAPIAVQVTPGPKVRVYAAGGNNPNQPDPTVTYHFFVYEDADAVGACGNATQLLKSLVPAGQKVWAAPVVAGDQVFFATSTTGSLDVCTDNGASPGSLFGFNVPVDAQGVALFAPVVFGAGDAVAGLRAYDGHLFVDNLSGTTTLFGAPQWKNAGAGIPPGTSLPTTVWYEP